MNSTSLATPSKLGLWTSTSLVLGNMIGAGVFLMPTTLASFGGISVVGWVCSALGAFLLAKVFANLSKIMPIADGGPYAYSRRGLGDFAGFLVAWGYLVSVCCANAAIAVSFVSALSTFIPALATHSQLAIATGFAVIWLLTWINSLGILTSGKVQLVMTILKIIPILAIGIVGLFFIHIQNFIPFNNSGTSTLAAITATTTFTFYAFLGIECATIPSGSVVNPEKNIPKATIYGTLIATFIYISSTVSIMGMIPSSQLQQSVTPFADAAVLLWGEASKYWVSAGVAIAAMGALNGFILIQGQLPYALAKDKLFPAVFAKTNNKGVPAIGMAISSVFISLIMSMNYTKGLAAQFKFLIMLSTLTVLIPYLFSTAAYLIIRFQYSFKSAFQKAMAIALALSAFLFSMWIVVGSGQEVVYWGFLLSMSSVPIYAWVVRKRKLTDVTAN
ncbi:MAG: amino acid permease [Chitinophagaceae bacterium]|nr:MAG: amino acid permease [Chitinophagaceae bacterium]